MVKRASSRSSSTEQQVILKDGRMLGFAEYGEPGGEPVLEFHGVPGSRLEAYYYDDAGKKVGARVIGIDPARLRPFDVQERLPHRGLAERCPGAGG